MPDVDVAAIRAAAGLADGEGPGEAEILAAFEGFAGQLEYWFERVVREAVPQYRKLVVGRINPFVRGVEYAGDPVDEVARNLVRDYVNRNFVTAGGWAIEKMAIALGSQNAKAAAEGIDLMRVDPADGSHHLYVIKSGTVTRNSDILKALKRNAEQARKLLMQGGSKVPVYANYAVAAGATSSTYHDNVHRPSSARFWSEITGLPEPNAILLAYEVSKVGGLRVERRTEPHVEALVVLVRAYLEDPDAPGMADWEFVFARSMREKVVWKDEDARRHAAARRALDATGYMQAPKPRTRGSKGGRSPKRTD